MELKNNPWIFKESSHGFSWEKECADSSRNTGFGGAIILFSKDRKRWIWYFNPPFQQFNIMFHHRLSGTDDEVKSQLDNIIERVANLKAFI